MFIKQLGNSGGLDINSISSSFLIKLDRTVSKEKKNSYLLVDIGYNVADTLIELHNDENEDFTLEQLDFLYITHMHSDHIANLEYLLCIRKHKYNIDTPLTILVCKDNSDLLYYVKHYLPKTVYRGSRVYKETYCNIVELTHNSAYRILGNVSKDNNNATYPEYICYSLILINGNHPGSESNGIAIVEHNVQGQTKDKFKYSVLGNEYVSVSNGYLKNLPTIKTIEEKSILHNMSYIFISGDTKADNYMLFDIFSSKVLHQVLHDNYKGDTFVLDKEQMINDVMYGSGMIFHDYSKWNDVSNNIHACEHDMVNEYGSNFTEYINTYRNGGVYNTEWVYLNRLTT